MALSLNQNSSTVFKLDQEITNIESPYWLGYDTYNKKLYYADNTVSPAVLYVKEVGSGPYQVHSLGVGIEYRAVYTMSNGEHLVWINNAHLLVMSADWTTTIVEHTTSPSPYQNKFIRPLYSDTGVAESVNGVIVWGEYATAYTTVAYRTADYGRTIELTLDLGTDVRHWHACSYDEFSDTFWLQAGDDASSGFWQSTDNTGTTWNEIARGSDVRAIGIAFTPDYIIWAQDHQVSPYILKSARPPNFQIEQIAPIEGLAFFTQKTTDNKFLIGTRIEDNSYGWTEAVLYLTDGVSVEEITRYNPGGTVNQGFQRGSKVDSDNRMWLLATETEDVPSGMFSLIDENSLVLKSEIFPSTIIIDVGRTINLVVKDPDGNIVPIDSVTISDDKKGEMNVNNFTAIQPGLIYLSVKAGGINKKVWVTIMSAESKYTGVAKIQTQDGVIVFPTYETIEAPPPHSIKVNTNNGKKLLKLVSPSKDNNVVKTIYINTTEGRKGIQNFE